MFGIQGGNKNSKKETIVPKNEVVKNKEVIAEYDEALVKENKEREEPLGKLEQLKQKLGLGEDSFDNSGIKTNLIDSSDVATFIDWKSSLNILVFYSVILFIIVGGALAYFSFLENEKEKSVNIYDEDIAAAKLNIQREEKLVENGLLLQDKISAVEYLIDNHVYWTNFFDYIEKNTLSSVYYNGFSGDTGAKFVLSATADKDYFNSSEQIKIFNEDPNVLELSSQNFSLDNKASSTDVSFDIDMTMDPEILYKRKQIKNE